jgi:type III secretion protein N (ATPase)
VIARGTGCVTRTLGESVLVALPGARIGDGVRLQTARGSIGGEVAAIEGSRASIAVFGSLQGIGVGDRVTVDPRAAFVPAGFALLGRAIDACGQALDGGADPAVHSHLVARGRPPEPGTRAPVDLPFWTGVRAIDALLVVGRGARVGIFGAPGAGKTTLLETIVAGSSADACVLALVGERGREAQTWLERLERSTTVVVATSDCSAAERARAADTAMIQAESLRSRGLHVLLVIDSLARYAAALRERKVALGEPVGRGGYPPSVWAELARYLERAGTAERGSITLIASVLSDGADEREPLSDAARSLLDGHIVLSGELARAGHFPAIDVPASASRTMAGVVSPGHVRAAQRVRGALALLAESKDARAAGLTSSADAPFARAVAAEAKLFALLRQSGPALWADSVAQLVAVAASLEDR